MKLMFCLNLLMKNIQKNKKSYFTNISFEGFFCKQYILTNADKKILKILKKYNCEICDYTTCNIKDYSNIY